MKRLLRIYRSITFIILTVGALTVTVRADNCGSLSDCYGYIAAGVAVAVGLALLAGLALWLAAAAAGDAIAIAAGEGLAAGIAETIAAGSVGAAGAAEAAGGAAAAAAAAAPAATGAAAVLNQLGNMDRQIFQRAIESGFSATNAFYRNASILADAVGKFISNGKLYPIGDIAGSPIFGGVRTGIGIAEVEGQTVVVQVTQGVARVIGTIP